MERIPISSKTRPPMRVHQLISRSYIGHKKKYNVNLSPASSGFYSFTADRSSSPANRGTVTTTGTTSAAVATSLTTAPVDTRDSLAKVDT